jgi:hypothetical protein
MNFKIVKLGSKNRCLQARMAANGNAGAPERELVDGQHIDQLLSNAPNVRYDEFRGVVKIVRVTDPILPGHMRYGDGEVPDAPNGFIFHSGHEMAPFWYEICHARHNGLAL